MSQLLTLNNVLIKWTYINKAIMEKQAKNRSTNSGFVFDSTGHCIAYSGFKARACCCIEVINKLCIGATSKERNNGEYHT